MQWNESCRFEVCRARALIHSLTKIVSYIKCAHRHNGTRYKKENEIKFMRTLNALHNKALGAEWLMTSHIENEKRAKSKRKRERESSK